jgi:hypothetical protein
MAKSSGIVLPPGLIFMILRQWTSLGITPLVIEHSYGKKSENSWENHRKIRYKRRFLAKIKGYIPPFP